MNPQRERFAAAQVAHLATTTVDGSAHVVPVVFACADDSIYTAVDGKPKSTNLLRRLANIEANPRVSVLVDQYDEDWSQLWWIRVDGIATIHAGGAQFERGRALLQAKYPQYQTVSLDGPMIAIAAMRWQSWTASRPATSLAAQQQQDNPQ